MTIFVAEDAHNLLANTIYGRPGAERKVEAYLACTSWEQFFAVNVYNTELFLNNLTYNEPFIEAEAVLLSSIEKYKVGITRYACQAYTTRWPIYETAMMNMVRRNHDILRYLLVYRKAKNIGIWEELEELFINRSKSVALITTRHRIEDYVYAYLMNMPDGVTTHNEKLEQIISVRIHPSKVIAYYNKQVLSEGYKPSLIDTTFELALQTKLSVMSAEILMAACIYETTIRRSKWPFLDKTLREEFNRNLFAEILYRDLNILDINELLETLND